MHKLALISNKAQGLQAWAEEDVHWAHAPNIFPLSGDNGSYPGIHVMFGKIWIKIQMT